MPKNLLPKNLSTLKVALVHDDLTVPYAGGEKIFHAMTELFPHADIFTSMATGWWLEKLTGRRIFTSFMQKLPFKRKMQKAFFSLYPLAFESFDLTGYDLVISSSTRFAHGVITKPETRHVCYMHSPGRMFWEPSSYFADSPALGKLLSPTLSYLRLWDYAAAQRVDKFVANSENTKRKIKKYYGREASVVHPFVDLEKFQVQSLKFKVGGDYFRPEGGKKVLEPEAKGSYFLVVTRLAPWKKVEIAVEAAKKVGAPLKVVGGGSDEKKLEKLAEGSRVEILGAVSDERLVELFQGCKAFIMTQAEDFGIAPLEAQACGKPVIAYEAGGVLETVVKGKTGEFFYPQAVETLARAIRRFDPRKYSRLACRRQAEKFSKERFQQELTTAINKLFR